MKLQTLAAYLLGNKDAIHETARSRASLGIGFLFVCSATLAREYDAHDLIHEPRHLAVPLAASVGMSALLYGVLCLRMRLTRPPQVGFLAGYQAFLSLFWMTAPLALLYAVPYERFLSDVGAAEANLCTLALVAVWRVLLISRVISVVFSCSHIAAMIIVLTLSVPVVVVATASPASALLSSMAGLHLTPRDSLVASATVEVFAFSLMALPFIGIAGLIVLVNAKLEWAPSFIAEDVRRTPSRSLDYFAVALLPAWLLVLPATQREQRLRTQVEQAVNAGRMRDALSMLSSYAQSEFPPQWEPPPRRALDESNIPVLEMTEAVAEQPTPAWVRAQYIDSFAAAFLDFRPVQVHSSLDPQFKTVTWPRVKRLLDRLPEGKVLASEHRSSIEDIQSFLINAEDSSTRPSTTQSVPTTEPASE